MRVRGAICSIGFVIGGLLLPSPTHSQSSPSDQRDIADVRRKLNGESEHLRGQNYRPLGAPQIEAVERGKRESFVLELVGNVTYAIVAACDPDCTHVIISLRDRQGRVLMQSPEQQNTVIISGTPQESGEYVAEVAVPGCTEEECYAGIVVLRLGASSSTAPKVAGVVTGVSPDHFITHKNHDLNGGDLRHIEDTDIDKCASACQADVECKAFSYDKWNRWCFIKGQVTVFRLEPNTITGLRREVPQPQSVSTPISMQRYRNKAFPWEGQNTRLADSFADCEERCRLDTTCVAFTFFKTSNQCRLMESANKYVEDARADSGAKRQEPKP
jgi:hypothetical protein